jgi:hypothetical protein
MFPFQRLDNVYGYLLDYDSQSQMSQIPADGLVQGLVVDGWKGNEDD